MREPLVVYQYPGALGLPSVSPPCLKVQLAFRLMGLEHRVVDLGSPWEVRRESPTGRVPCVDFGDDRVADSVAILDAAEERFPHVALSPADPAERARDRLWEHFATDTLYWLGFYQRWVVPEHRRRMLDATFRGRALPLRLAGRLILGPMLARRARGQGIAGWPRRQADAAVGRAFATVEHGLEGGPFLGGRDAPARGDVALAATLVQVPYGDVMPRIAALLAERPAVVTLVQRVFAAAETRLPDWFS